MIDQTLQRELLDLEWFVHCGDAGAAAAFAAAQPAVQWVDNVAAARRLVDAPDFEDVGIDVSNEMRAALSKSNKMDVRAWNQLAAESLVWIRSELMPRWQVALSRIGIDGDSVAHTVSWHVQGMFFELAYPRLLKRRINLDRYRPVYQAGFLPCGWTGDWRSTTLQFY
jgi:hypothetical protein